MPIAVEIVTPTKVAHKSVAKEVRAPGFFGEFGVLPDHVPFLTVVEPGLVTITSDGGERAVFVVGEGFAERARIASCSSPPPGRRPSATPSSPGRACSPEPVAEPALRTAKGSLLAVFCALGVATAGGGVRLNA